MKQGAEIDSKAVTEGFGSVSRLTGLVGRWTVAGHNPLLIVDTAHNTGGWKYNTIQLAAFPGRKHLVLGFVGDKDVTSILGMLPADACYYFATPGGHRALPSSQPLDHGGRSRAHRRGL